MEPSAFEPLMPPEGEAKLEELAVQLVARSNQLAEQLHPVVRAAIGDLVRSVNCYCSNLIEGHNTHPRDIDRALNDEYSKDPKRRELQLEARAHIEVQRNGYFRCCFHLPKGRRPWSANYRWFGRLWQIRIEANAAVAVAGRVTCRCGYM
jgi:hypothetical protein